MTHGEKGRVGGQRKEMLPQEGIESWSTTDHKATKEIRAERKERV